MAEFPTYEEMAKNIAEKALDEFLYDGKSIREWMQIIASEDCISRKAVLKTLDDMDIVLDEDRTVENYKELLEECYEVLPPVKPQTPIIDKIRCEIMRKDGLEEALEIIDKYTSESEEK